MDIQQLTPQILTVAGLTLREAKVWLAMDAHGDLNVSAIARFSGLTRPAVYRLLVGLMEKNLIASRKQKRRVMYHVTGAKRMLDVYRTSRKTFTAHFQKCAEREKPDTDDMGIRVYRGKDIAKVWEELASLPKGSTFYRYDGYAPSLSIDRYVSDAYRAAINKKQIERFVITNAGLRNRPFKNRIECVSKIIPADFDVMEFGISQFIYNNTIAFVDFTKKIAFVIENPAVAGYQKKVFEFLLRSLKE
ncbi:helix-turn-helix domain-containing protein [Candidatus Azambacteria bacterium]|nr:helix-turn-helix domain-containing protein [Candidatus Azambacteria bacterium]MBI3685696.1 helix-turn-helix domain-containing protein [Candidatus Azambacteria bacterium]